MPKKQLPDGGIWRTMRGHHVYIYDGKVIAGAPKKVMDEINSKRESILSENDDTTKNIENVSTEGQNVSVISSNTSTGDVIRIGDSVYKNTTFKVNGTSTLEAEVYDAVKGIDGFAPGESVTVDGKPMIKTPRYVGVISVDTIKKEDRPKMRKFIEPNYFHIIQAINTLTQKGYAYSDPLQFGVKGGKLDLMDFSNASKVDTTNSRDLNDLVSDNYSHVYMFLRQFGMEDSVPLLQDAMTLKSGLRLHKQEDLNDDNDFLWVEGKELEQLKELRNQNDNDLPNVYYTRDLRPIMLGGTAQVNSTAVKGKYVFSEKPLSPRDVEEWELHPLSTQA